MKVIFFTVMSFLFTIVLGCDNDKNNDSIKVITERNTLKKERIKDMSDPTNELSSKVKTIELRYVVWGCACANWVESNKYIEYQNNGTLAKESIFIEPAERKLELPDGFDAFKEKIIVKGQFYINPDYPKGTQETEESIEKAPVFRYTEIKIEEM